MKSLKQRWLNSILHLSSVIYSKKEMMKNFSFFGKLAFWVQIIVLEIFLSLISLPFYFFVVPNKAFANNEIEIKTYRLRRKITFTTLAIFLAWHLLQFTALFSGIVSSPRQTRAALTVPLTVSGSYVGNGSGSSRAITGVGFQPDAVIIKGDSSSATALIRTSTMVGDISKFMSSFTSGTSSGLIQSLDSDGFTLGTNSNVNSSSVTYYWTAFKAASGYMTVNSYTGDGNNGHAITGVGFQPDFLMIVPESSGGAVTITSSAFSAGTTYALDGDNGSTGRVTSLDTNGFTLGTSSWTNSNATKYDYIAWKRVSGRMNTGSYSGTGSSTTISAGFQPEFAIVKSSGFTGGVFRNGAMGTNVSISFTSNSSSNQINSFSSGGFDIGTGGSVNSNGTTYYYAAFIGSVPPTFTQSAYRFFNNADSTNVGSVLAANSTPASLTSAGQAFRLRTLMKIGNDQLVQSGETFKLQYAGKGTGTCASPSGGTPSSYTDVTGSTVIAYKDNATPTDGSALTLNSNDPTNGADTVVTQTYEEANNFTNSVAAIPKNQDGEWDFALYDNNAPLNTTYCFRMVKSDGTALDTYSVYPEVTSVNDTTPPTVSNVTSSTANGTYTTGGTVSIQVVWSEAVNVTGTPQLTLATGGGGTAVNYTSGSGTNTLTFTYTVGSGQNSSDLDYASTSALALNSGTIKDLAGNDGTLTLPTPGAAGSLSANKDIVIDTAVATVSNVTSSTSNGSYSIGTVIPIQVVFSKTVNVTGTPQLTLATGGGGTVLNYTSGSGSTTLVFNYTVGSGQNASDLDYASTSALALNGGTIKDGVSNDATLTLATPGTAGSLGANKDIVIDTTAPTVTNVTSSTANGSYTIGGAVSIQVTFSEAVNVTGTPQLTLATGGGGTAVNYSSGTGTNTLTFAYTVGSGQNASDLDYVSTSALGLNSGTIRDAASNNATLTLATPGTSGSLGANKDIVIDTTAPTVTNVTSSTANGSYTTGGTISIQVGFSETVNVTGTPQLSLNSGGTANYSSGTGTSTLTFSYTVGSGQNASDLDYASTSALSLNGGTIKDGALNNASLTLSTPGTSGSLGANKNIVIDTAAPTVLNVTSSTVNGSYAANQLVSIQVAFSEAVNVTGTPQLSLNSGGTATYSSGTGTSTLTFSYTVGSGQNASDLDYVSTSALSLNGGTIKDLVSIDAILSLPTPGGAGSLGANKNIVIDTTAPTVTNVTSSTANGSYTTGGTISIQVSFSKAVTVTGTPQLTLETGLNDAVVNYDSGSGTDTLTFVYTISSGENSSHLDYVSTSALALNGGTIADAIGNNAALSLSTPGTSGSLSANKNIIVDTTPPMVGNVTSSTINGSYTTGGTISIQVVFNKVVNVTGTPQLTLATGGGGTAVNYSSGTGTNTLTFTYTVGSGQNSSDLDYLSNSALSLHSGTIKDALGNDANLTLPNPGSTSSLSDNKDIVIDTTAPSVTNVTSSNANGAYTFGDTISVQVVFDEAVVVTEVPQLTLATGTSNTVINYTDGSGTNTLNFIYTIGAHDSSSDLDYASTSALALNSGTIKDTVGNNANLTLPTPGSTGSLGANKDIVISTLPPTVTNVTSSTADGVYTVGGNISLQVTFSKPVIVTGTPQLSLATGVPNALATYVSGSETDTLTFAYTVAAGQNAADLDYASTSALSSNGGTIKDSSNTNAVLTLPTPGTTGSLSANKNLEIDTMPPDEIRPQIVLLSPTSVQLTWHASGDDSNTGTATSYDLRYGQSAITESNFSSQTQILNLPTPEVAGTIQTVIVKNLVTNRTYYFALRIYDNAHNVSVLSENTVINLTDINSGASASSQPSSNYTIPRYTPPVIYSPTPTPTSKPNPTPQPSPSPKPSNQPNSNPTPPSPTPNLPTELKFIDIARSPFKDSIEKAASLCNITGYTDKNGRVSFRPEVTITRAEIVTLLVKCRFKDTLPSPARALFTDLPLSHWASPYIQKGIDLDMVDTTKRKFRPNDPVSTAEALKLTLFAHFSKDELNQTSARQICQDISLTAWYAPYFTFAFDKGIFTPQALSEATFCNPERPITRGEVARLIALTFS